MFSLDVEPEIQGTNLIIPFYIDNIIDKGRERLIPIATNAVYSAARKLQEVFGLGFSPIDFVDFVEKHRRALFSEMLFEDFDRLKAEDPDKLIAFIKERYFHGYAAVFLKYFLNKSEIRKSYC